MSAPPARVAAAVAATVIAFACWVVLWHGYFGWGDEVQFVDPAAGAHFGQGFTSTAWPYQTGREFFAGNAPGYSLLLVPWFAAFAFGLEAARWFNVPLAAIATALLFVGLDRVERRMPAGVIGLAVGASLLGAGMLVSAGSARYDMLCLLAAAWVFERFTAAEGRGRRIGLVAAGALVFYAGFHLAAAVVVMLGLLAMHDRRRFLAPGAHVVAGIVAGLASWLVVLATKGLLVKFFVMLLGSQHTISGQMAKLVLQGDKGVLTKGQALLGLPLLDPSLSIFALLAAALIVAGRRPLAVRADGDAGASDRLLRWIAFDVAFVLPVALLLIGKFPVYYSWMAYVPAVMVTAVAATRWQREGRRWPLPAFVFAALAASVIGLAHRASHADVRPGDDSGAHFDAWVRAALQPGELVYADHEAYFAARGIASRVIAPTYGQSALVPGIPERDQIAAIVVQRANVARVKSLLGGSWRESAAFADGRPLPSPKLDAVVLRRDSATR
jgi:hypothetical protein